METVQREMAVFNKHCDHVAYHKDQMRILHDNFPHDSIIIKCDFIQNIVHGRGRETSQSFYNKRQSQLLTFVIWYWEQDGDGQWMKCKRFVDYLSSYLKHNSLLLL